MPTPKLKDGQKDGRANNSRPKKEGEKKTAQIKINVTPSTAAWVKSKGRGWLVRRLESLIQEEAEALKKDEHSILLTAPRDLLNAYLDPTWHKPTQQR